VVTFNPDDPHVSKKPHALRAFIFADWIRKTFEKELKQGHSVLDIAGGKGEIAMFLSRGFGVPTIVIEPKERKLQSYWYARLRRLIYRFETGNMDRPDWESGKINVDLTKWPHDETPHYMHTVLDDQFLKDYPDIISNASVFIGLHSDQATEPIVDAAIQMGRAFAVVPCCVFSHENRERRLKNGQLVTTTEDFIQYLMEKDVCGRGNIEKAYLDFEGKNQVVYWKPQINNK
jgi:hypothetical protein